MAMLTIAIDDLDWCNPVSLLEPDPLPIILGRIQLISVLITDLPQPGASYQEHGRNQGIDHLEPSQT